MTPTNKAVDDALASILRATDKTAYDLKVARIMMDDEYQLRLEYQRKRDQWRRWACLWFSLAFVSWAALAVACGALAWVAL